MAPSSASSAWIARPGGEDAEYLQIGQRRFLATAGIRAGKGPYELDCEAVIYEWIGNEWVAMQHVPTFAAKQWRAFSIEGRHFLALAQGVTLEGVTPKHPSHSCVFEWNGERFAPFLEVDGAWGYDWVHGKLDGEHYLAYADHLRGAMIYRWNGTQFDPFQTIDEKGARSFRFFRADGASWMVCVNLLNHTTLYHCDGTQFVPVQKLRDAGGRELCLIDGEHGLYLLLVCFVTGTQQAPVVETCSHVFRWIGNGFEMAESFASSAATDAATFVEGGQRYVIVSNSLSHDIRFGTTSMLYRFDG
jgi:hypothetical protein